MTTPDKTQLVQQVILGAREYGIGSTLFRQIIGEKIGVNATDMECLALIFFKGLATPSELARHTGLSSGATTAMLDRLEKGGLIERRANPNDRRSSHIVIVEQASGKMGSLFASLRQAQNQIVSSYSESELQLLAGFFRRSAVMWEEEREKLIVAQAE